MEDAGLERAPLLASDRGALSAVAFCAPWLFLSLLLSEPSRSTALALVATLAALLAASARWSWHRAHERGLDEERWAFLATVTMGASMAALLLPPEATAERLLSDGIACGECGRVQLASEAFCFGCGAT